MPFPFDTHAIYFSDDAVRLEGELHQAFAGARLNHVNARREFFFATPDQVREVLASKVGGGLPGIHETTRGDAVQPEPRPVGRSRGGWRVTAYVTPRPAKTDTFVLDFRNEAEANDRGVQTWYERTTAVPTDPNPMSDLADRLYGLQLFDAVDAAAIGSLIADRTKKLTDHGTLHALLDPIVDRFEAATPEVQDEGRDVLDAYVRAYSFLSQVVDFGDVGLEALCLTSRAVMAMLPPTGMGEGSWTWAPRCSSPTCAWRRRARAQSVLTPAPGPSVRRGRQRPGHRAGQGEAVPDRGHPQRVLWAEPRHRRPAVLRPAGGHLARR